jgi:branched-chain amino acid transport system substrate-binding protein
MKLKNLLLFGLLFLLIASCGKKEEEIIKVGAVLSLTGTGAEYGKDQQKAITLVLEQQSSKNYKYKYDVVFQDSKSDPKEGVNAVRYLLSSENCQVFMTVLSSVSMAIKDITENNNKPLFCVAATPKLTPNTNLVFRSLPTSEYQAEVLAQRISEINPN